MKNRSNILKTICCWLMVSFFLTSCGDDPGKQTQFLRKQSNEIPSCDLKVTSFYNGKVFGMRDTVNKFLDIYEVLKLAVEKSDTRQVRTHSDDLIYLSALRENFCKNANESLSEDLNCRLDSSSESISEEHVFNLRACRQLLEVRRQGKLGANLDISRIENID